VRLRVSVIPRSGRSELKKSGNSLKVWLKSAPEDGKANAELMRILADKFDVKTHQIEIISGFSSRKKVVDIMGVSEADIEKIP